MPRRTNKPLTEKRRRARINRSLTDLKSILLADRRNDCLIGGRKQSKLEKADILEMTVRHFHLLHIFECCDVDKYQSGYAACIKEAERFLSNSDYQFPLTEAAERELIAKLLRHLESCLHEIERLKITITAAKAKANELIEDDPIEKEPPCETYVPIVTVEPATPPPLVVEEEPELEYLDEPLDYSMTTGKLPVEIIEEPIIILDETISNIEQPSTSAMYTPYTAAAPTTFIKESMQTLFPTVTTNDQLVLIVPQLIPNSYTPIASTSTYQNPYFTIDNDNALNEPFDDEWRLRELRRVYLTQEQAAPSAMEVEREFKTEMVKLEAELPEIFENMDAEEMDQAVEIKENYFDDPMWRPW